MPNWCLTEVKICGPEKEVIYLRDLLANWLSTESDIKSAFGADWLGNIAQKAGLDWKKVPCRGGIYYFPGEVYNNSDGNKEICFEVQTAWTPMHEIWHFILNTYAPNCKYIYTAEEIGNNLWETNDKAETETICIDYFKGNEELRNSLDLADGLNYMNIQQFYEWAKEILHVKDTLFNTICKKLTAYIKNYDSKNGTKSNVHVRKMEFVNPW